MDGQETPTPSSSNKKSLVIPVAIAAVVILGIAGIFAYQSMNSTEEASTTDGTPTQVATVTPAGTTEESNASPYKDGRYEATGSYVSPGGPREVDVVIVIEDGTVTDSEFQGFATDPNSKRFQGEFADGFKEFVVGKPIDEIEITKVSGSSLTPKGFMDALEDIKQQAQA